MRGRVQGDSIYATSNFRIAPSENDWSKRIAGENQFAQGDLTNIRTLADGTWQFDTLGIFKTIIKYLDRLHDNISIIIYILV